MYEKTIRGNNISLVGLLQLLKCFIRLLHSCYCWISLNLPCAPPAGIWLPFWCRPLPSLQSPLTDPCCSQFCQSCHPGEGRTRQHNAREANTERQTNKKCLWYWPYMHFSSKKVLQLLCFVFQFMWACVILCRWTSAACVYLYLHFIK